MSFSFKLFLLLLMFTYKNHLIELTHYNAVGFIFDHIGQL